ncbi:MULTISPECIES: hypothetical protein [unclassified Mesorhizobium]|uniref:hypothetical protein n=3 Tax=Mesorhizobium TaxID=68287 RepID=UPI000FC99D38|nr:MULTISPECIES: hypothetical protein [unclassified Mesorhizobium]RUV40266.1 hypothetical protein EOD29_28610 [Mesorhizobium sp. M1A.T.Ca.IN.004.03.1.1]RWI86539.1 MAG: hypothetical protein EOR21_29175 [Mesorhizobium sp.]RWK91921.1 MAG: hypothetical protein EOR52_01985 [Mesorhizobium sp.]
MQTGKKISDMSHDEFEAFVARMQKAQDDYIEAHPNVDYDRFVTLHLPMDARFEFNVGDLAVSARELLTMLAEKDPDMAETAVAIRNEFYAGDDTNDHVGLGFDPPDPNRPSREELAEKRRARAKLKPERDAEIRKFFELHERSDESHDEWAAIAAPARAAVAAERLAVRHRSKALDRDWDAFVIQRETWPPEQRERLEQEARTRLKQQEDELDRESQRVADKYSDLLDQAYASIEPKAEKP